MNTLNIRSMSDLDAAFKEAIISWEVKRNRAPLTAICSQFPDLLTTDAYDIAYAELREEGEL